MTTSRITTFLAVLAALAASPAAFADCTTPQTFDVTSPNDDGSPGTLRFLVNSASVQDCDTIEVPPGLIVLDGALGQIKIKKSITIHGAGADETIIDGNGVASNDRIFEIDTNSDGLGVTLSGITVRNGKPASDGGGILVNNSGFLNLVGSSVIGNDAGAGDGGGVYVSQGGGLVVDGSKIAENTANTGGGLFLNINSNTLIANGSEISGNTATIGGGGIGTDSSNSINMEIVNSRIVDNKTDGNGGGIYHYWGSSTLTNVEISGNTTTAGDGGGIYSEYDMMILDNCLIANNRAGDTSNDQYGGGITSYYSMIIQNSTIRGNQASASGGGIYNYDDMSVQNSTIADNVSDFDDNQNNEGGGGVYNEGRFYLQDSIVSGNVSNDASGGGGLYNYYGGYGHMLIDGSLIENNTATNNDGGGVRHEGYTLNVRNSTIANNKAKGDQNGGSEDSRGGGIYNVGDPLAITNSTIVGNEADGSGGGIYNDDSDCEGTLSLNNVTIALNTADANDGGVSGGDGGGLYNGGTNGTSCATVLMTNTIIGGNVAGGAGSDGPDCFNNFAVDEDALILSGTNLIQDITSCDTQGSPAGILSEDPLFETGLADNGGKSAGDPEAPAIVKTLALQNGSPAIDAGLDSTCELVDERGVERPADGDGDGDAHCDLGAFEAAASSGGTTGGDTTGGDTTGGTTGGTGDSGGCSLIR
ncbi:MAG TPA: choice-of-anchor Q domain-containing protein [bacterium]|nr:choice-of-anchor Q domain-containing protein [bacterium]